MRVSTGSRSNLNYSFERSRLSGLAQGALIAGVDEAGIGPWAGPVIAAAVCLDPENVPDGLNDSKQLPASRREILYRAIMASAQVGIGIADVARIDRDNVLAASHWAMAEAISQLRRRPGLALVDGCHTPGLGCPVETLVGGDGLVASIAAASIIAKVTRDRLMLELAGLYPGYGFERHMGYGTQAHRQALHTLGVAPCHRRSFRPVKAAIAGSQENNSAAVNPSRAANRLD